MLTKYKIVPFCPYHFVHTILSNAILSVYHFVHTILSVPFCPLPFCPVTQASYSRSRPTCIFLVLRLCMTSVSYRLSVVGRNRLAGVTHVRRPSICYFFSLLCVVLLLD